MTKQQENEQVPGMREQRFGIEIELTGLTRRAAADIIGDYMGTTPVYIGGFITSMRYRIEKGVSGVLC